MDLDITFLLQFGLFVILLLILNPLLLRPMLQILEQPHEKIHGMRVEIERLQRQAAEDRENYEEQMGKALKEAQKAREEFRVAGREEERRILNAAREDVGRLITQAREEIRQAEVEAEQKLEAEVEGFAKDLMHKIVPGKDKVA